MDNNTSEIEHNFSTVPYHGAYRDVPPYLTIITGVILSPIILLGVLGNLFSLLVWIKGRRRKTSTARYLSVLAIADITVLLTAALDFWISYVIQIDVKAMGTFPCKFLSFMAFWAPCFSAWILMAVTVERAMSVWIPHRINVVCRPVTALIVSACMGFLLMLLFLPILIGVDIATFYMSTSIWTECTARSNSFYGQNISEWFYIDLFFFFFIPFLIMIISNSLILTKVVCLANRRNSSLHARGQNRPMGKNQKMLKTVTRRIVILSLVYISCNLPLGVLNVILMSPNADEIINPEYVQTFRINFHILMYLNNGVNFLLYCMIGSGFRKDFIGIFRSSSRTSTTR
ncbi:hypothetical protein ACF0H5_007645 [Mactra antiquata]